MVYFLVDWGMGDSKHTSYKQQNDPDQQQRPEETSSSNSRSPDDRCEVDERQQGEASRKVQVTATSCSSNQATEATTTTTNTTIKVANTVDWSFSTLTALQKDKNQSGLKDAVESGASGQNAAVKVPPSVTANLEQLSVSSTSLDRDTCSYSSNFTGSICRPNRPQNHPLANVTAAFHQFLEQKSSSLASGSTVTAFESRSVTGSPHRSVHCEKTPASTSCGTVTHNSKELSVPETATDDEIALQPLSNQVSYSIQIFFPFHFMQY